MTQPDYVPITSGERVRPAMKLPVPIYWTPNRPADLHRPDLPTGTGMGVPGPDQGYALLLSKRFAGRLVLNEGEHASDAEGGCLAVATKRASIFGRAPVIYDWELAYRLWGFLGGATDELVDYRKPLFRGAAEDYWRRRVIAAAVPEETLRMTPEQVAARLGEWRELLEL